MIANNSRSKNFGALARYLTTPPERVAWTYTYNLATEERDRIVDSMRYAASASSAQKPVYHISVHWDNKDRPTRAQMLKTAERLLAGLQLAGHQTFVVAHKDTTVPHLHLMVNLVHPYRGTIANTWQDKRRTMAVLRDLERENGWRIVPERRQRRDKRLSKGEQMQLKKGQQPFVERVRKQGGGIIRSAQTWSELEDGLREKGLTLHRTARGMTITDTAETVRCSLSRVGHGASLRTLTERFGQTYEKYREQLDIALSQETSP